MRHRRIFSSAGTSKLSAARQEAKKQAEGRPDYKQILDCLINAMSVQQVESIKLRFKL